jgi:hypothetical protein
MSFSTPRGRHEKFFLWFGSARPFAPSATVDAEYADEALEALKLFYDFIPFGTSTAPENIQKVLKKH